MSASDKPVGLFVEMSTKKKDSFWRAMKQHCQKVC